MSNINKSQASVDWRRVTRTLGFIFGFIAVALFILLIPRILIFLFFIMLFLGGGHPAYFAFTTFITVSLLALLYYSLRKRPKGTKALGLFIGFFPALFIAVFVSMPAIPIYLNISTLWVAPQMERYLEKHYHEEFTVIDARACTSTSGFTKQSHVCASAYPKAHPQIRFSISENNKGSFQENYLNKKQQSRTP